MRQKRYIALLEFPLFFQITKLVFPKIIVLVFNLNLPSQVMISLTAGFEGKRNYLKTKCKEINPKVQIFTLEWNLTAFDTMSFVIGLVKVELNNYLSCY